MMGAIGDGGRMAPPKERVSIEVIVLLAGPFSSVPNGPPAISGLIDFGYFFFQLAEPRGGDVVLSGWDGGSG